ncbi:MAG: glycosyltransferase [Armatimonadota bacterium]|nr:glycosyltransferase [Armatimonadota bacterium]
MVLTRELLNPELFPYANLKAFCLESPGWRKRWADLNYKTLRRMSAYERHFYERQIRDWGADLLHAHFAVDASYFIALKQRLRTPLVVSCYGYDVSSFPNRYFGLGWHYLQPVWRWADLVLAMSNDMRTDLVNLGCPSDKIKVHYHGIDLSRFGYIERPLTADKIRILFVGSLTERKGVNYVLQSFAQIADQRPQVELRFVGEGPLRSKLERSAQSLRLENRLSFAGFVRHEHLRDELNAAHIFCHPSVTMPDHDKEGIPGTIVEAMATGLPVVTTRHAGIPEIVTDGEHGFVVSERDIAAITRSLLVLIDNPALRAQMGAKAAQRATEMGDAIRQTAELESIYKEVLSITSHHS